MINDNDDDPLIPQKGIRELKTKKLIKPFLLDSPGNQRNLYFDSIPSPPVITINEIRTDFSF